MRIWMAIVLAATALSAGCGQTETQKANLATATASGNEQPGSSSHAEDAQFCDSHECIANFPNGHGTVVQCSDGKWSHSGGIVGACTDHGGEKGAEAESPARPSQPPEESKQPEAEGAGSLSHSGDAQFCSTHQCIANFSNGRGAVVECKDGEWSHSGGISGACSSHGGENASPASPGSGSENESPSSGPSSGDPLETLNTYWSDVRDHGFATAYSYLAPGAAGQSESEFVSGEQRAGISNAQFHGTVTSNSGSTATVTVDSLVTEDAQFGCRRWSGSYTLTKESGEWRISRAAITPHGC
jgi:hypothetical protein